ncbi:MAG TPA: acylneuraminate cytidylyltransferase family protein [Candidatus Paceibacterota bacterium]
MKIIAIIPARGNSLRIRDKNIKNFAGKPLIAWTILEAKKSKLLDRIIVSTDSPVIAKVAKKYGAEVPFLRPAELAIATIGVEPVLKHTYEWLIKNETYKADAIVLLQSTNPLRTTAHIDEAVKIFIKKKPDSVVTVNETPANHTPYWTLIRQKNGKITLFSGQDIKNIIRISQDFPQKCYARNDLIYVFKPKNLFEKNSNLYGDKVELYITSPLYEADINTYDEWLMTEMKFKKLKFKVSR